MAQFNFFPFHHEEKERKRAKFKTCCTNGPQPNIFFSFTQPRGTGRNFPTHRSIGPRPIFLIFFPFTGHLLAQGEISRHTALPVLDRFFLFFYATSWNRADVLDALLKRSTQLCCQTNQTKHHCQTTMDLDQSLTSHTLLKGQARKIGANRVNNLFGPQLAKQKTKQLPRYIATLIHKKQTKKRKQTRATAKHNIKQPIIA